MAFYQGIDEDIYEGGDHYVPMQQFRLNQSSIVPQTIASEVIPTSTTSYGIPAIYPSGGGGDTWLGGGIFGDLDPNKTKEFTKDVWSEVGPGKYGWKSTKVEGFYDPKTGQYKTWEGKNINHAGIDIKPMFGSILEAVGVGDKLNIDKTGGRRLGSIKGTFTEGWDQGLKNIKEGWEEEKDKWGDILQIDKAKAFFKSKKDKENIEVIDEKVDDTNPANVGTTQITTVPTQLGGADGQSGGDYAGGAAFAAANPYGGSGTEDDMGADTFRKGGRVYLNLGGLASILGREGFKKGGRKDRMGGTMEQTAQELREAAPDQFGGTMTIGHGGGDNQNNNNTVTVPTNNYIDINPDLLRTDPHFNLNVMSPLEMAKLQATIGYRDIFDNDDLSVEGDLTTNIGPINTSTQFTDDGIGNTDINWGNFSTTIDANKNLQNIGYNNEWNGINYGINYGDGNTMFNVGTTFKNGGLASIL